jgi:peptide-methionine (S)-S-oxide reductase
MQAVQQKPQPYRRIGDHSETIEIDFDPKIISYVDILNIF